MSRIKIKDRNCLEQIPVKNPESPLKENGQGTITVDMTHKGLLDKLAQELWITPRASHIKLDRFGSSVQKQIDSSRSLIEIGILVKEEFGDKVESSYKRLTKYSDMLKNNRFVSYREQQVVIEHNRNSRQKQVESGRK